MFRKLKSKRQLTSQAMRQGGVDVQVDHYSHSVKAFVARKETSMVEPVELDNKSPCSHETDHHHDHEGTVLAQKLSYNNLGLESLHINIGGIPRSDMYGWTPGSNNGSSVATAVVTSAKDAMTPEIKKVYGQLGQLTSLCELHLGHTSL